MGPMPSVARAGQELCANASVDMLGALTGESQVNLLQHLLNLLSSAGLVAERTRVLRECAAAAQSARTWAGDQCANVCPGTT